MHSRFLYYILLCFGLTDCKLLMAPSFHAIIPLFVLVADEMRGVVIRKVHMFIYVFLLMLKFNAELDWWNAQTCSTKSWVELVVYTEEQVSCGCCARYHIEDCRIVCAWNVAQAVAWYLRSLKTIQYSFHYFDVDSYSGGKSQSCNELVSIPLFALMVRNTDKSA